MSSSHVTTQSTSLDVASQLENLTQRAQEVLTIAKALGATAAEVAVNVDEGFDVTVRRGEVETLEYNRDKGMGITVYFDQNKGSASTSDLSHDALQQAVSKACDIAKYTTADPCNGLADPHRLADPIPEIPLYFPWGISTEEAIESAQACEAEAMAVDKQITNTEGASISTFAGVHVYANSNGFLAGYPLSRHSAYCSLIAEKNGEMERDYDYTVARDPQDLLSFSDLAQTAAKKTLARLGARQLSTQKCPVIFTASMARGLIGNFIAGISGSNLYRRTSFLVDSLHQQVFPEWLQIDERPHLAKGLGSVPFDAEGVAVTKKSLVDNGRVQSYLLGSYSARQLGMATTGNAGGAHNVFVKDSGLSFDELMVRLDKGLIVTDLMGHGVNLLTGDYSRGAAGFWVEHGKIQYPVHEITIASNLAEMFAGIQAVATDNDPRGNIQTGSLLLDQMTVAGQ